MDKMSVQSIISAARSNTAFFNALRVDPESVISGYAQIDREVRSSLLSVTRDGAADGLQKAGFHDGCRCTSCGCGGSIIFPVAQA